MPSPFPGMDPYVEGHVWAGIHHFLISHATAQLQPQLRDRGYYATPGERVWLTTPTRAVFPDVTMLRSPRRPTETGGNLAVLDVDEPLRIDRTAVEIREPFLEIYDAAGHEVVTGIEFISPANKADAAGRDLYQRKQSDTREAGIHLVEVDLIRRGPNVLEIPDALLEELPRWDYVVNLARRGGDDFEIYPIRIRNRLPRIRVPLKQGDEDAVLDLQAVFEASYDACACGDRINYAEEPAPPLADDDAAWANDLLKQKGLRQ